MSGLNRQIPQVFAPLLPNSRYKAAWGGRGSGKSHFFAEQAVLKMYEKPKRIVGLREVQSSIKESVKQLVADKIEDMGLQSQFNVLDQEIRGQNGSLMIFKGLQSFNAANVKSLEGYDVAWLEEAQNISHASWRILRPTIRKSGSEIWCSWNPRFRTDAIDMFFRGKNPPDNAVVVKANWQDNPFLPEVLYEEMMYDYENDATIAEHVWGGGYEVITTGSYYGKLIAQAEVEGRITFVPHDKSTKTFAGWDLGIGDPTAIWIFQIVGLEWHFLKYYENKNEDLAHYVDWINKLPYNVDLHILPHDAEARELQTGFTRTVFLEKRGCKCHVLPKGNDEDGVNAVRGILPASFFDVDGCEQGINTLRMYHAEFDETLQVQKTKPLHDWSSHGAKSFEYAAVGGLILGGANKSDWKKRVARESHVP